MSIATEIERLKKAKNDLFRAVTAKGGVLDLSQKLDEYASGVDTIPSAVEGSGKYRVRFFDYDGTILKTVYTDGGEVTAPSVPEHERLLFQEWNNDFDDISSDLDVGAIYTTKSGMSEFDFDLNAQTGKSVTMRFRLLSGTLTLDWGDETIETITTLGTAEYTHEYSSYGKYTVKVAGDWHNADGIVRSSNYCLVAAYFCNVPKLIAFFVNTAKSLKRLTFSADNYVSSWGYAMQGTNSLTHVNIPRGVVATPLFMTNSGIRSISLPNTMTALGQNSFQNCPALKEIILPQSLTKIDAGLFADANVGFSEITIPVNVTEIGTLAFRARYSLSKVVMKPTTPPSLAADSFPADGSLKEIIVPAGCGEDYKSATNWSTFADIIKEEE